MVYNNLVKQFQPKSELYMIFECDILLELLLREKVAVIN